MAKIIKEVVKTIPRNVAYLRVSTTEQDCEKNKADILKFANDRAFGHVEFIEEKASGKIGWKDRKIAAIIDQLGKDDKIIVPELSRIGRSMVDIMSCIAAAKEKGISIYDVKNGFELNGRFAGEVLAMVFSIAAQIERDLISARTIEGLKAARAKGKLLGRPRGPGKSKLDAYRPEIIALLNNHVPKNFIAERYHCTPANLHNWLGKNAIKRAEPALRV
ncbi:MAG: recombinase family protein [Deltaproteobacteria bacterium]|nr:recombinase family protein [Deltaproteobacteria bacterium]